MTNSSVAGSTFFGIDISGIGDQLASWSRRLSKRVLLLEFGNDLLRLSETSITPNGIQLNHITLLELPPEALERGVPADPKKMAGLLQQICVEKKIRAHRVAVVLPPEVGFQRIVELPAALSTDEARGYVQDAKNGIQIPFPLAQTDFDLSPILFPGNRDSNGGQSPYLLTAIPQLLVDRIIETLQILDFELQLLELGTLSQLRAMALDLTVLPSHQIDLVLELLPDSSHLLMVTSSGLLAFERLSAIRNFPDPELDDEQVITALDAGLSAESFVVNDESYLPLSALDLRVFVSDFKRALQRFYELCPGCEIRYLKLAGINSAHPLLANLLQESLGLSVQLHRPLLSQGVSGFSLDDVLVQAGLGRLVGLGLGLLSREQLLSCPLSTSRSENNADNKLSAVGMDQFIAGMATSGSTSSLPFFPATSLGSINQQPIDLPSSPSSAQDTADEIQLTEVIDITNEVNPSLKPQKEVLSEVKEEEWPSIGGEELKEEVLSEVKEEEWPSIGGEELKEEVLSEVKEEEWPSIGGEELKEEVLSEVKEEEWPSIGGEELKEEVLSEVKEEEWPSIGGEELKEEVVSEVQEVDVINRKSLNVTDSPEQKDGSDDGLLSIPGLKSASPLPPKQQSSKTLPPEAFLPSDSLGELRFSDDD